MSLVVLLFFFFTVPASPAIYTLSLHDALPISADAQMAWARGLAEDLKPHVTSGVYLNYTSDEGEDRVRSSYGEEKYGLLDRKSTRLNSSHTVISYAVFCLKKKIKKAQQSTTHK